VENGMRLFDIKQKHDRERMAIAPEDLGQRPEIR
jgi:hypothetical protein